MKTRPVIDERRIAVWEAFAEQFLDTERRHEIPSAAMRCILGGFSVNEAHRIWAGEVVPVVGYNCLTVAGEWMYWPTDWLVERCSLRVGAKPGWVESMVLSIPSILLGKVWRAIEDCMEHLAALDPARRETRTADLTILARHYFDFVATPIGPAAHGRLAALYEAVFLPIFAPLAVTEPITRESPRACDARVRAALASGLPARVG